MSETKVPSIPIVPTAADPALFRFLQAVRETILVREGQKGDSLDSAVTFRDLIDAGIAVSGDYKPNPNTSSVVDAAAVSDSTPPPDPINATVAPAISSVMLTWQFAINRGNLAYVKIWRSGDNLLSNAQIIGTGSGSFYVDYAVVEGQPYHYWIQAVSNSNVDGSVISMGTAIPATDPAGALTQLKSYGVEGLPYYHLPEDVTVNGVLLTKGTYIWNAVIGTATIGTAQIKDAAITSAKVANLTADKISFDEANGQVLNAAVINGAVITGSTSISAPTITGGEISGTEVNGGTVNGTVINGGEIYVPDASNWRFKVENTGQVALRSATTGARMELANNVIKVFDTTGSLRVQIGDLSV
jgi:hypothetical protein